MDSAAARDYGRTFIAPHPRSASMSNGPRSVPSKSLNRRSAGGDGVPQLGPTKIYIEVLKYGARGAIYQVRLGHGRGVLLVKRTLQPLFDGARALIGRGIIGGVEVWDGERSFPRISGDIAGLAKLTTEENNTVELRLRPWKPFSGGTGRPNHVSRAPDTSFIGQSNLHQRGQPFQEKIERETSGASSRAHRTRQRDMMRRPEKETGQS